MKEAVFAFPLNSPWDLCIQHYLDYMYYDHSQSKETLRQYRYILTLFFGTPPQKLPGEYTKADVLAFMHSPSRARNSYGQPPAPSIMNLRLNILKSFYAFAATFDVIRNGTFQPILHVPPPTMGLHEIKEPRVRRTLSEKDVAAFFAAIPDTTQGARDKALFAFYLLTARRVSEIARLVWSDLMQGTVVDLDGTVREAWLYRYHGKGGKERTAELPALAKKLLDMYLLKSGRMADMEPNSPLFLSKVCGRCISPAQVGRLIKQYAAIAGLDSSKVSPHVLRHTSAQIRYIVSRDIFALQRLLDHSMLNTTWLYVQSLVVTGDKDGVTLSERFSYLIPQS